MSVSIGEVTFCVTPVSELGSKHEQHSPVWSSELTAVQSMPSFFNLYRNARNVMPNAAAARVLL